MEPLIEIRSIGKRYDIAHMKGGYISLRDVISTFFKNPFGHIAHKAKQAVGLEKREEFWALRDVSFSIKKGEVVGVIGQNGAGKSTLLKILSQITPPTEGEITLRGRVGSLLEVGTGFHPELTGRENIFLNGAILGMKRKEIASKFDQIVEFAGIEKFLDTPVKHYSSGMYVRLAFSVAAFIEPEILLIDEVLAVGDAEFQKKCLGKMDELTRADGRTIMFVSHNLSAIGEICDRVVVLDKGRVAFDGPTDKAIEFYSSLHKAGETTDLRTERRRRGNGSIKIAGIHVENSEGETVTSVPMYGNPTFVFDYECADPAKVGSVDFGFSVIKSDGRVGTMLFSSQMGKYFDKLKPQGQIRFKAKNIPFTPGTYLMTIRIMADNAEADWINIPISVFEIVAAENQVNRIDPLSLVELKGTWSS